MANNKFSALLMMILLNCQIVKAGFDVSEAINLDEFKPIQPLLVDALWLADKNLIVVSKHGSPPETLVYNVDFVNKSLSLVSRQTFQSFAPVLLRNRDFVLAFRVQIPERASAELYKLDDAASFQPLYTFAQDVKNIAATLQSNFVATIDYAKATGETKITPRLKLFSTVAKNEGTLTRQGNAIGVISIDDLADDNQSVPPQMAGRVTALAMSPLGRSNDAAANRVVALGHSSSRSNTLHLWYFPSIDKDFSKGRGHIMLPFADAIDTIQFSPNTFGLMLATNTVRGKIYVMQFDLANKMLISKEVLKTESANKGHTTHIAAGFGENDAIVAGINNSVFLFEKNEDGKYVQTDIQPADFKNGEYFSKIEISGHRFVVIGTKGSVQFGTIRSEN